VSEGQRVSLAIQDQLAVLRLTRAAKRNAIDEAFLQALGAALDEIAANGAVKVLLLEAEGPAFCAGFDLDVLKHIADEAERSRRFAPIMRERLRTMARVLDRLSTLEAVTIAAVQGAAAGGGFSLALACDFRVITTGTRCWFPEVALGSALSPASTALLVRLVPAGIARDIVLNCRRLDAGELQSLGLANRVTEVDELAAASHQLASELLEKPATALLTSKATIDALVAGDRVVRSDLIGSGT